MWIEKGVTIVGVWGAGLLMGVLVSWFWWSEPAALGRLHPAPREILVREVANGYLVEARTQRGIYPYVEWVFARPDAVGSAVAGLLGERVPPPRWGP